MKYNNNVKITTLGINILTYSLTWFIYYIFEMLSGRMVSIYLKAMNLMMPMAFFTLWSIVSYNLSLKYTGEISVAKIISAIFIFIIIDQGIKNVIRIYLPLEQHIKLIDGWLYLYPIVNTKGSWAASRFGLDIGINMYIIFNIIFLPIIICAYKFYSLNYGKSIFLNSFFVFVFSGAVCSLIDKVFFGGSLDYILMKDIFVADLKDIYITLGSGNLIVEMIINTFNDKIER